MNTIGERIADLRIKRGLTQTELGEIIGESKQTIYKYERGIVTNIPIPKVVSIAEALRCSPDYLAGWDQRGQTYVKLADKDARLLVWFRSLHPEKQKAILISQDAPEGLL